MTRAEMARFLWNLDQVADKKVDKDGKITYSLNGREMVEVTYNKKKEA